MSIDTVVNNISDFFANMSPEEHLAFGSDVVQGTNIGLTGYNGYKDIRGGKAEIGQVLKTGSLACRVVKLGASNTLTVLGDKGGIFGDTASFSFLSNTAQGAQFVAIAGPAGGIICTVSDLTTLYRRGVELHELKKQVKEVENERPGSLTHKYLIRKRELQRWLVASSCIAVAADGAVLTGTFMASAGLGAGVGSTAVAGIRMLGEDHLNDSFKKDLEVLVNDFEIHNPHVLTDKDREIFEKTFQKSEHRYEHAKAKYETAKKDLETITKNHEQVKTGTFPTVVDEHTGISWSKNDELGKLEHDQNEALKTFEKAEAALKKIEPGYKHLKGIHEDLESYKACKALILNLDNLIEQRDYVKSEIQKFEDAYKKEYGESFEHYKQKHFGEVNPAWQKRVDTLEQRLLARKNTYTEQLPLAEKLMQIAEKRCEKIRSKLQAAEQALKHYDGSNVATGGHVDVGQCVKIRAEIRLLRGDLEPALDEVHEERTIVKGIKQNIEKTEGEQASLAKYVKDWQHLSKVREKIMFRHRGYDNEKAIVSADELLKHDKPFKQLLSPENLRRYEAFQLQQKQEREKPAIEGNHALDETHHGVTLRPQPIQTEFGKAEKSVTPTAKIATPSTERAPPSPEECLDDLIGHISNTKFLADDSQHKQAHEQLKYIKQNHPQHFEKMKEVVRDDPSSSYYLNNIESLSATYAQIDSFRKHILAFKDLKTEKSASVKVDSPKSQDSPSVSSPKALETTLIKVSA